MNYTAKPRTLMQHKMMFALFGELKMDEDSRKDVIRSFSNGRTESSSELYSGEAYNLIESLKKQAGNTTDNRDRQRKAIIAIFRRKGKTVQDAIAWAEQRGVKGIKRSFNDYTGQELYNLTIAAERTS